MKRFFISILSPIYSPLLLVLLAFLYYDYVSEDITGDLGRNGQIVFSKEYRMQDKFNEDVQKQLYWCNEKEIRNFDVVFFGDSFTKHSFPYYLTNILQKNTAKFFAENIDSPEQTFVSLCNAGVEMPSVVILESVERYFVNRLKHLDFDKSTTVTPVALVYKYSEEKQTDFSTFYKNQIIDNRSVRHLHLKESLFSCPNKEKDLYFYHDDLNFPCEVDIRTALAMMDTLFNLAHEKHIHLFYVIAADKYDVYQDFAIDNHYPKKNVLDRFSRFESNPYFVNTKNVLYEKAIEGVTDLYYVDDTHWSPVGEKIVAEEIARRINSLGIFQY